MSAFTPAWVVVSLLMIGGLYLCYEGCEKLAHNFLHSAEASAHEKELRSALVEPTVDMVELEKQKIKGAIRTDFILSAEIIVITLGTVDERSNLGAPEGREHRIGQVDAEPVRRVREQGQVLGRTNGNTSVAIHTSA